MENWDVAPIRTRIQFVLGAVVAGVDVVGIFVLTALEEFEVVQGPR